MLRNNTAWSQSQKGHGGAVSTTEQSATGESAIEGSAIEQSVDIAGHYDWPTLLDGLNRLVRLRTTPILAQYFSIGHKLHLGEVG